MVFRFVSIILSAVLISGCFQGDPMIIKEPVELKVPVQVKPDPPEELIKPFVFTMPVFYYPDEKGVTSALKRDDEINIKIMINELIGRDNAWRAWATEKEVTDARKNH